MEQLFEDAMRNPAFALAVSTSGGNLDPLRMYDWLTRMRARLDPGSGRTFDDIGAVVHKLHETCLMVATEINLSDEAYRDSAILELLVRRGAIDRNCVPLHPQQEGGGAGGGGGGESRGLSYDF